MTRQPGRRPDPSPRQVKVLGPRSGKPKGRPASGDTPSADGAGAKP